MINENFMIWNVRGLNSRARRNVVRELITQENLSLEETKLDDVDDALIMELCGVDFDYCFKPATNTCGGILLAWKRHIWSVASPVVRDITLTAQILLTVGGETWCLTNVYGPQDDAGRILFLEELRSIEQSCSGPWMICGDFNLIYRVQDKNNGNLNRRMMGRFKSFYR